MEIKRKKRAKEYVDNPSQGPWTPKETDRYPEQ